MSDQNERPDILLNSVDELPNLLAEGVQGGSGPLGGPLVLMRRDDLDPSKIREVRVVDPQVNYAPMGHDIIKQLTRAEGFVILAILVMGRHDKRHNLEVVLVKLAD